MTTVRGGQWGSQALKVGRAPKGNRVLLEFQGPKACQASRETRVPQGRQGPAVEWATRGWLASPERKARRASRASRDPKDSKESAENLATPAPAEMREPRGCRATRGLRALEDWLETEACRDSPGGRAWRAEMLVTSTSRTWC